MSYKGVKRVLQGCYKVAVSVLEVSFKRVTRMSQECFECVTFTRTLKVVCFHSSHLSYSSIRRACFFENRDEILHIHT